MSTLLVLAGVVAFCAIVAMFVHALRAERSIRAHRWLVLVPLLVIVGWLIEQLIMG
jgi:hypothetical protein